MDSSRNTCPGQVSVIIPVYNVERFLSICIESVLRQTCPHLELILVDDGSPDRCPEICDSYARQDERVQVIHQENRGQSAARNRGIDVARGEYIYFLDSDDFIAEQTLETLIGRAQADEAEVVLFDTLVVDESGALESSRRPFRSNKYPGVYTGPELFSKTRRQADYTSMPPLLFIRKSFLKEIGLRFYEGIVHEDELFTFLLLMHCRRCTVLPDQLFFRRIRQGSTMTTPQNEKNITGLFCVLEQLILYYQQALFSDRDVQVAVENHICGFFWQIYKMAYAFEIKQGLDLSAEKNRAFDMMETVDFLQDASIRRRCRMDFLFRRINRLENYWRKLGKWVQKAAGRTGGLK